MAEAASVRHEAGLPRRDRLPPGLAALVIAGSSAALWALLIALARAVL